MNEPLAEQFDVTQHFDASRSSTYDDKIGRVVPGYDAMHEMTHFLLRAQVAEHAKVLVVGAGTGKLQHRAGFGQIRKFYSALLFGGYVAKRQ